MFKMLCALVGSVFRSVVLGASFCHQRKQATAPKANKLAVTKMEGTANFYAAVPAKTCLAKTFLGNMNLKSLRRPNSPHLRSSKHVVSMPCCCWLGRLEPGPVFLKARTMRFPPEKPSSTGVVLLSSRMKLTAACSYQFVG